MSDDLPLLIDRPQPHGDRVAAVVATFKRQIGRMPEGIAEAPGRVTHNR
jgi:hypothetical protein